MTCLLLIKLVWATFGLNFCLSTAKKSNLASKKAEYKLILFGLKKSKYSRLKNEDNLTEAQALKLIEVKEVSPILKEMHELQEKIRKCFNRTDDWYTGVFKLGMW